MDNILAVSLSGSPSILSCVCVMTSEIVCFLELGIIPKHIVRLAAARILLLFMAQSPLCASSLSTLLDTEALAG